MNKAEASHGAHGSFTRTVVHFVPEYLYASRLEQQGKRGFVFSRFCAEPKKYGNASADTPAGPWADHRYATTDIDYYETAEAGHAQRHKLVIHGQQGQYAGQLTRRKYEAVRIAARPIADTITIAH